MESISVTAIAPHTNLSLPALRKLGDTGFQYQGLEPKKNEIRVLSIQAGQYESSMECRIVHVSLDSPPPFTAISYAWGDPEDTCLMHLDGHEFPLTRTLYGALQALRSTSLEVVVWADAVCINQANIIERGLQVQIMTKIYASAKETCLWLGLEEHNSARGLALMDDLAFVYLGGLQSYISEPDRVHDVRALVDIFERGYWDRLWCVQELWHSKTIVVYCGRHRAFWAQYRAIQSSLKQLGPRLLDSLPYTSITSRTWSEVLQTSGPCAMGVDKTTGLRSRGDLSLIEVLTRYRNKICQDPRDRVYSILWLLPRQGAYFPVDYSISVWTLFTDVIQYCLEEDESLDSICISSLRSRNQFSLPSWVPDWTTGEKRTPLVHLSLNFAASAKHKTDAVFLERRSKLQVSGIQIDKLEEVFIRVPSDNNKAHELSILQLWRAEICRLLGCDLQVHDSFVSVIRLERSLLAGTTMAGKTRIHTQLLYAVLESDPRIVRPENVLDVRLPDVYDDAYIKDDFYHRHIKDHIEGCQMSLTTKSLLCLSTGRIAKGDTVFVLKGCSVPVVLRHLYGNEYKFIGEIYVDGYMHGKAIEECENGMRKMETVVLV